MTTDYINNDEPQQKTSGKIFTLGKAPDPDSLTAIRLREEAARDSKLDDGSFRLLTVLIDLSLHPQFNSGRRGQVLVSQQKLGELTCCDERTIRRRVTKLDSLDYLWLTSVPMPNMKPMHCYHLIVFQPRKTQMEPIPGSGLWGNGKRRRDAGFINREGREVPGGALTGHQRRLPVGLVDHRGEPISSFSLGFSAPSGQNCPLPAVKSDRSQRTLASSPSGHQCPLRPDTSVLSQRSNLTAGSGQDCPLTPDTTVRHIEPQREPERPFRGGKGAPADGQAPSPPNFDEEEGFVRWKRDVLDMFPSKRAKVEQELRGQLERAKGEIRREAIKRRLAFLRDVKHGGLPPDMAEPKPKPAMKAPETKPLNDHELLAEAEQILATATEAGIRPLLTDAHRSALRKAGAL